MPKAPASVYAVFGNPSVRIAPIKLTQTPRELSGELTYLVNQENKVQLELYFPSSLTSIRKITTMNKTIASTLLGLVSLGSMVLPLSAAHAYGPSSQADQFEETISSETFPEPSQLDLDFSTQVQEDQQVAYNYCYYEVYSDGSYYWICY